MIDVIKLLEKHKIPYIDNGDSVATLCLNPNHHDTHIGSFNIRKDGVAHCFACGFSTNIFGLCNILGEKVEESTKNIIWKPTQKRIIKKKKIVYHKPIVMGNLYNPFNNKKVLDFMYSIGMYDDFINKYGVKYTTYAEMISDDLMNTETDYTQMHERIVIPIYHNNKIINYECRTYSNEVPKVKYVRGCSTQTIFNLENIDPTKMVVVVESIKNLAKIWNVYPNVISIFHNLLTDKQAQLISNLDNICIFADNDIGGLGGKTSTGFRDGMIQSFIKNYKKPFKLCYDPRIKRSYDKDGNSIIKGYDANDCTLGEIKEHIQNAQPYEMYEKKKREIIW